MRPDGDGASHAMRIISICLSLIVTAGCSSLPTSEPRCDYSSLEAVSLEGAFSHGRSVCGVFYFDRVDGLAVLYDKMPAGRGGVEFAFIIADGARSMPPDLASGDRVSAFGVIDARYSCFEPGAVCVPIDHPYFLERAIVRRQ